jgi:hypothetical protein
MPRLSRPMFLLPLAAALTAGALPAAALSIGDPVPPRDPYAVPPPPGCVWGTHVIPHTTPPVRPVVITPPQSVWSVRGMAGQPSPGPWPSRGVSFTYNLTQLDLRVPSSFDGRFLPSRVVVEVFSTLSRREWSRTHLPALGSTHVGTAAAAGTALQQSSTQFGGFSNLWRMRISSVGSQIPRGFQGGNPPQAMIVIECELPIQPPPPPVVGP